MKKLWPALSLYRHQAGGKTSQGKQAGKHAQPTTLGGSASLILVVLPGVNWRLMGRQFG